MMPQIAVFGDVFLDRNDFCDNRENPESSAPCYRVRNTKYLPGGAGNAASNLVKLGSQVTLYGIIGEDEHGSTLVKELESRGIKLNLIRHPQVRTIVKQRILSSSDGRYHARLDFGDSPAEIETIRTLQNNVLETLAESYQTDPQLVLVSDYAKGFITEQLMDFLRYKKLPIYVDPKQDGGLYTGVELIKPNRKELSLLMGKGEGKTLARTLSEKLNANVLLTLGEEGMFFVDRAGETIQVSAEKTDVVDVTGCGDTAIATLAFYRALGKSWRESIELANKAAGINARHIGCYAPARDEIESS